MEHRRTALTGRCLCGRGCASLEPGHELHAIRACAAMSMPSRWVDALVIAARTDGVVEVVEAFSGRVHELWNHSALSGVLVSGEPVALQAAYGVLAVRGDLLSVRPLGSVAADAA